MCVIHEFQGRQFKKVQEHSKTDQRPRGPFRPFSTIRQEDVLETRGI